MTTNGNRPPNSGDTEDHLDHRQHQDGLGIIHESGYNPRRRRNDAITTGLVGFMVGGVSGLAALGVIGFLSWFGSELEELVGFVGLLLIAILAGGVTLAVSGYRSVR